MGDAYNGAKDRYSTSPTSLANMPARNGIPVTPSDTKDVTNGTGDGAPTYAKSLYVGVPGDITVIHACEPDESKTRLYKNVPAGWFPVQVRRVMFSGTTATNIMGLYDQ